MIYAHIIEAGTGQMLVRQRIIECPRVGDQIRLTEDRYYAVTQVVWCLDELSDQGQRVNIGVRATP
jgi:hypothetical protein